MRFGLVVLVLVAATLASLPVAGQMSTYNLDAFTQSRDNPATGTIFSRSISTTIPTGLTVTGSHAVLTVNYDGLLEGTSSGVWAFTVTWNGNTLCSFSIESGLATAPVHNPRHPITQSVFCRLSAAQLAVNPSTLAASRSVGSGTPSTLSHETISYRLDRTDFGDLSLPQRTFALLQGVDANLTHVHDETHNILDDVATVQASVDDLDSDVSHVHDEVHTVITGVADLDSDLAHIDDDVHDLGADHDHLNDHLHDIDQNVSIIMGTANVTVILVDANFSLLANLEHNLSEHRNGTLELNSMAFDGLEFDGFALALAWIVGMVWCLRRGKVLASVACTIGVLCILLTDTEWVQWVAILLLLLALWLEAMVMEGVYTRWFSRRVGRSPRITDTE